MHKRTTQMSKHLEDRAGATSPDGTRNALLFPFQTNGDQSSYKEEIDGEGTQQRGRSTNTGGWDA